MAKVLVVDDSVMMRRNLTALLEESGHEVIGEAKNGMLALSAYEKYQPDLVTMDITMPVMDGITAVKKIIEAYPDAIIIMISAQNQQMMVYDAIKSGAKNYLLKPIRVEKLKQVIIEVLP
ncbi:MAG: two-component system chemotaxis response regulator CheY [Phenylobacterium sp.]|jgi:two-component system chemotaxis response regulator CheY